MRCRPPRRGIAGSTGVRRAEGRPRRHHRNPGVVGSASPTTALSTIARSGGEIAGRSGPRRHVAGRARERPDNDVGASGGPQRHSCRPAPRSPRSKRVRDAGFPTGHSSRWSGARRVARLLTSSGRRPTHRRGGVVASPRSPAMASQTTPALNAGRRPMGVPRAPPTRSIPTPGADRVSHRPPGGAWFSASRPRRPSCATSSCSKLAFAHHRPRDRWRRLRFVLT